MKVRSKAPAQPEDAEDLAATVRSPGYALIAVRMNKQRADYAHQLTVATSWDEVVGLQAQIRCVDRSLEIPDILRRELTASSRKE